MAKLCVTITRTLLLYLCILVSGCSSNKISGLYIPKRQFNQYKAMYGSQYFHFYPNEMRFEYKNNIEQWEKESSGTYKLLNKKMFLLNSDTNIFSLPVQVEKTPQIYSDSISLDIKFTCNFTNCSEYLKYEIEIDDTINIALPSKENFVFRINNRIRHLRFRIKPLTNGVIGINDIYYSSYIIYDPAAKVDYSISYKFDNNLSNYRTFNNDTILVKCNSSKLFLSKDSMYYYRIRK